MMTAWWTEQMSGVIGGIGGGGLGVLGGMVGAAIGVMAPRGVGKPVLVGFQALLTVVGCAALVAGVVAIATGQPRHVHFPLVGGGAILAGVMGALLPVTLMAYRMAATRRSAMGGEDKDATRSETCTEVSPGLRSAMVREVSAAWGAGGTYRRWTLVGAAGAGMVAVAALAWIGVAMAGADAARMDRVWSLGQLAFIAGLDGLVLWILAVSMGRQARRGTRWLEEQRMAAEDLRRG